MQNSTRVFVEIFVVVIGNVENWDETECLTNYALKTYIFVGRFM